jgi:hypothetical protein
MDDQNDNARARADGQPPPLATGHLGMLERQIDHERIRAAPVVPDVRHLRAPRPRAGAESILNGIWQHGVSMSPIAQAPCTALARL